MIAIAKKHTDMYILYRQIYIYHGTLYCNDLTYLQIINHIELGLAIGSDIVYVGCLGCIGDCTTQLYGDFHKPL